MIPGLELLLAASLAVSEPEQIIVYIDGGQEFYTEENADINKIFRKIRTGKADEGMKLLNEKIRDPNVGDEMVQTYYFLACKHGFEREAYGVLNKLTEDSPTAVRYMARGVIGDVLQKSRAKKDLHMATTMAPGNYITHYNLGMYLLFKERGLQKSIRSFERSIELQPKSAEEIANVLVQATDGFKDRFKSREYLEKALQYDTDNVNAHFRMGTLEFDYGNFEAASLHLLQAISRRPNHSSAHYVLARSQFNIFRRDNDQSMLRSAIDHLIISDSIDNHRKGLALRTAKSEYGRLSLGKSFSDYRNEVISAFKGNRHSDLQQLLR